jgi:hypothetical protein
VALKKASTMKRTVVKIAQEEQRRIKERIDTVIPLLNEYQTRLYLAAEAESLGWGGKTKIAELSGKSRMLIARGKDDLQNTASQLEAGKLRRKGGGRKKEKDRQQGLVSAIKAIIEPHTVGDPERLLLWTSKSVRHIMAALRTKGYSISHELIRQILAAEGYSLQTNRKTLEGGNHEDRDAQFVFINDKAQYFISNSLPVISVDCKKKELIGKYKNSGKEWHAVSRPTEVNVYDFIDKEGGKASPYGVYDLAKNRGFVSVGISSDTAEFAVATIRSWWYNEGKSFYPDAQELYITADGGGSNGRRNHLWKRELQLFANETGLKINVSHFPPGTSKWNKIEHRLFAQISMNWREKPLESLFVILGLIKGTTTATGLAVNAIIDEKEYKTGIKITKKEIESYNIKQNDFHGEWNYCIERK